MVYIYKKPSYIFFDWYGTLVKFYKNPHGYHDDVAFIEGALDILHLLKNSKIPFVLCSNQDHDILLSQVASLNVSSLFSGIFGVIDGVRPKPHTDLLHAAIQTMNIHVPSREILFVGDSYVNDYQAAHAMNFDFIGIGTGFEKIRGSYLVFKSLLDFSIFLKKHLI